MPGKKLISLKPNLLLRKAREARGWTQREVADLVGAPHPFMVNRWENGVTSVSPFYRAKLAVVFEKTAEELGLLPVLREHSSEIYDPAIPLPLSNAQELIGRDALLDQLRQRLCAQKGLVQLALHGLPGVGKTTLAVQLVNDPVLQATFKDGILWAGVGPHPNQLALLSRWGNLLEVSGNDQAGLRDKESWIDWLHQRIGTRQILIVIDDAWTIDDALSCTIGGPNCAYLLTTRIPDVALSFAGTQAIHMSELEPKESIQLLTSLVPALEKAEPATLSPLVQATGGLPLALTLLGHHLLVQTSQKGERRLQTTLNRLRQAKERIQLAQPQVGVQRDFRLSPDSALSLQAIIGLSEAGLDDESRQMLYALAVFPAKPESFTEEAALAVTNTPIHCLDRLVDAGLVEWIGPDRYALHQTISDYACTQSHDKDAEERMARYFIDLLASQSLDDLMLEQDTHNILRALQFAIEHQLSEEYFQGVLSFVPFLRDRALYQLAEPLLEQARSLARLSDDRGALLSLLLASGQIALYLGKYQETEAAYQEGLQLARQSADTQQICLCLLRLGGLAGRQGDIVRTEAYFQEGLQLARQLNDMLSVCQSLQGLGTLAIDQGKYALANTYLSESLELARQLHSELSICALLNSLGAVAAYQADTTLAERYLREAMNRSRQAHLDDQLISSLARLGALATEHGSFFLAVFYLQEGQSLARKTGSRERMVLLGLEIGRMLRKQQKFLQARASFQESLELARQMGHRPLRSNLLLEIGELALQTADIVAAEAAFHEILEQIPEKPYEVEVGARYGLAQVAAFQGQIDAARALGERCLAEFSEAGYYRANEVRAWLQRLPTLTTGSHSDLWLL